MKEIQTEKIQAYLEELVKKEHVPSVDLLIQRDHQELFRYTTGKGVTEHTKYLMFSMTKIQTMTCMMQLLEKNQISLEDEVGDYLPAYRNLMKETEDGKVVPIEEPLKIWHLLSMQSGLDYDLERPGILRVLKEKGASATTRDLVDAFVESPLKFQPGTHFCYSLSHDVAAAVLEVVTGVSFSEYLKKNIWEPLEMENTFFAKPENDGVADLAQQYMVNEQGKIVPMEQTCNYQLSERYESGGAGLISCTADYGKIADTLACGGVSAKGVRILQSDTVERIKKNRLGPDSLVDLANTMGRKGYGYGCGMQVLMNPEMIGAKAPAGVFGWDGAAGSCTIMDTKTKTSLVYVQHVRNMGYSYDVIHPTLRDMVF